MANSLFETLEIVKATYSTNSASVLYWIHNEGRLFKPFVANRAAKIQQLTNPDEWRHIPGEQKPADLSTRGLSATDKCSNKSWIGPSFLADDELTWPEKL